MSRIALLTTLCGLTVAAPASSAFAEPEAPRKTLTAFASEQELADVLKRWANEARCRRERRVQEGAAALVQPAAPAMALADKVVAAESDSVTNVQHAGVDEGGIVKVLGEHLVTLRRGRLFTVRVGEGALRPVAASDAFGPGIDPRGAWYDEMLIAGNTVAHAVDRIEALGAHAVAVGSDGANLRITSLRLGRYPAAAGTYMRRNAAQGETRSHGFFYRPDGEASGVLGLPIIGGDLAASNQLHRTSVALLFVRNRDLAFSELGTLQARADDLDDGCKASCVDWYGNARPLFIRGRAFALLGYEIVEGLLTESRIVETGRIDYADGSERPG